MRIRYGGERKEKKMVEERQTEERHFLDNCRDSIENNVNYLRQETFHFRQIRPSNSVKMGSRGVLLLLFLVAMAMIVRTSTETSQRNLPTVLRVSNRERVDLSAEGTGSDYPKQFGTPLYAQHHGYFNRHWTPYNPHRPLYHEDHYHQMRIDPYVAYIFTRYAKFLPQGLGLYGIYGSTGLPYSKPPGIFTIPHRDK